MGWTTPTDRTTGYTVTAADWNVVEDNLTFLVGSTGALVNTTETTASAAYTDLTTTGPSVTLTTGTKALVFLSFVGNNNTASDVAVMTFAVSGATTIAAADINACQLSGTANVSAAATMLLTGLTAGSNTFTAKYKVNAGTGSFQRRNIVVVPLP